VLEPGKELVLFRLGDRGPEGRILVVATRTGPVGFLVDEVVRVLRYDPATCVIDWDAIRLPAGITTPR
jgi:hypothetical protein